MFHFVVETGKNHDGAIHNCTESVLDHAFIATEVGSNNDNAYFENDLAIQIKAY